jgi:hypothetical protein
MTMSRNWTHCAPLAAALLVAGCATTSFTSTWKAPDAQPLTFKAGDKVIALVVAKQTALRRSGEANLADELDKRGLVGVPAYTLIEETEITDEGKAKRKIDASGAAGVVVIRPMGQEKEVSTYSTGYYGAPYYGGFWGGYYGYGWGGAWGGTEVRTDTYVSLEILIYDLRQNKLIWAGQTRTLNPSDVEGFVIEIAAAVSEQLRASGLVAAR